jgi:hypothetical protein
MPAQRNQRSTRPATTRAGSTFGIAVCSLCACILPGSETSRRLPTWHETVLGIDSRTAR